MADFFEPAVRQVLGRDDPDEDDGDGRDKAAIANAKITLVRVAWLEALLPFWDEPAGVCGGQQAKDASS